MNDNTDYVLSVTGVSTDDRTAFEQWVSDSPFNIHVSEVVASFGQERNTETRQAA